jgi:hypothetical protein
MLPAAGEIPPKQKWPPMTRLTKSLPDQAAAVATTPAKFEKWSQILLIACHVAEHREELQAAMDSRRLAAIRSSLARSRASGAAAAEATSIVSAISLVTGRPGLFRQKLRPVWLHLSRLLAGMTTRRLRICMVVLLGLMLLSAGIYVMRTHSFDYWKQRVSPVAEDAARLQQQAGIVVRKAAGVGISPLGASVHAEGALMEINKFNASMRGLIVSSTDPAALQSAFAEHPDARQVADHDSNLARFARQHLMLARKELGLAEKVVSYGEKWRAINPYAELPDGLSPRWSSEVAVMSDALNSGDLQKIEAADLQLENIKEGGEIAEKSSRIVAGLSVQDRATASPYLVIIDDAVVHGALDKARPALATLSLMEQQAPLSYSLYLVSLPGEKSLVVKQDAHDALVKHYYLIVQPTDEHGAAVPVSIHDGERGKNVDARRFGIEVSADTFEQVRSQRQTSDGLLLIGKKTAGTVATEFSLPVLDGRISSW